MITMLTNEPLSRRTDSPAEANGESQPELAIPDLPSLPDETVRELAHLFKLLADETRLRVLFYLMREPELNVRTLCELLAQSQPAVSHHLALLRVAGLIESRRDGKHNFYRIVPRRFQELVEMFFSAAPHREHQIQFEDHVLSYEPASS